jgi:hypothetical protein
MAGYIWHLSGFNVSILRSNQPKAGGVAGYWIEPLFFFFYPVSRIQHLFLTADEA